MRHRQRDWVPYILVSGLILFSCLLAVSETADAQHSQMNPGENIQATGVPLSGGAFSGNVCVTPPASLGFCTSTTVTAPADGELLIVDSSGTGVHWDMATTANTLILTDEADNVNTIYLQVHAVYLDNNNAVLHPSYIWLYNASNATLYNHYEGGDLTVATYQTAGTVASGGIEIHSANQANAGNYASGDVLIHSGATNTDGNTGSVYIYSEVAGAGAADAGNVVIATHGGAGVGQVQLAGWGAGLGVEIARLEGTNIAAGPGYSCDNTHAGTIIYADDTDDSAAAEWCQCIATGDDGAGNPNAWDWVQWQNTAAACSFF